MRIITGKYGGRRFNPPAKMPYTRPTTDIAKEGLFDILQSNITMEGIKTLDLFGGTGSISYELASRGATELTIVEKDAKMHAFIKRTTSEIGIKGVQVVRGEVFRFLENCNEQYDFIFAGPPYALNRLDDLPGEIYKHGVLKDGGWFVLEHTPEHHFEEEHLYKTSRNYGTTVFSIFVNH